MDWFLHLQSIFQGSTFLQGLVVALSTLILEDPATVASGLLVASGAMPFLTAFIALTLGIAGGDFGLYWIGRMARDPILRRGWIKQDRLVAAEKWTNQHGLAVVAMSRFVPGMRLPTYLTAGSLRMSPWAFLLTAILASMAWSFLLLTMVVRLGRPALARAGSYRWLLATGVVLVVLVLQWMIGHWKRSQVKPRVRSTFEFWPPYVFYPPVLLYALWLSIRHQGIMLPTAANPSIYSGGMIMESKSQILSLIPDHQQSWVAPWVAIQTQKCETAGVDSKFAALQSMAEAGLTFPIVAKPDVGQRGAGVRKVRDEFELGEYLAQSSAGHRVILQSLVPWGLEAGVLYYRIPGEESGRIFSITLKEFPELIGDGVHSIEQLILLNPRARLLRRVFFKRHADHLQRILRNGEVFPLVFSGNHCQGAIFRNGESIETPELAARIHDIASSIPGFFFGRFDIRFRSLEEFQQGKAFQIVEVNGASAEATHIWDPDTRLLGAYRTLFQQFGILFKIGAKNRDLGYAPLGLFQLFKDLRAYSHRSRTYPMTQ